MDEAVEGTERRPLDDPQWITEYGVTMAEYESLREIDAPCPLCSAGARALVLLQRTAAESNARVKTFIESLAATSLSMSACTDIIMAIWNYQHENPIPVHIRRMYTIRHLSRCGIPSWSARADIRMQKRAAVKLLHNIERTENVLIYINGFLETLIAFSKTLKTLPAVSQFTQPMYMPVAATNSIPVHPWCMYCHADPGNESIKMMMSEFRRFCLDGSASIDGLNGSMCTLAVPTFRAQYDLTEDDIIEHTEMHLLHHETAPHALFFILRCAIQQFRNRSFGVTFSRDEIGPQSTNTKLFVAMAVATDHMAKIKTEIERQTRGARCFGTALLSGVSFTPGRAAT